MRLGRFRDKALRNIEHTRRVIVIKLFSAVVLDTPVDSGRLRGNWQTTIGSGAKGVLDRLDPSGGAAIGEATSRAANLKGDDSIYLTNNLPYARRIEYEGWSKKAPEGMVRKNVVRFQRLVGEAARVGLR